MLQKTGRMQAKGNTHSPIETACITPLLKWW